MTDELVVKMGVPGLPAAAALELGDVITLDAAGKWAKTTGGEAVWFACFKDAAADELVAGRRAVIMRVKVYGHDGTSDTAVAVGDDLYVDDGRLSVQAVGDVAAKAMETVAAGDTTLIKVLVPVTA